jgi:YidC/Oxa1 family membrane protein insertase
MDLWAIWLDAILGLLNLLSSQAGMGLGFAIIVATLLLRTAVLPISWDAAYRGCIRHKRMARLQPQQIVELYRKGELSLFDGRAIAGGLVQIPLFLGMFQALQKVGEGVRFLWIPSLAKPDTWLAIIAGVTTALAMAVNPDLPEQTRMLLILLPSILAVIAALNFCSALAVYWTTSNLFTAAQTVALHYVVRRRVRSGKLRI